MRSALVLLPLALLATGCHKTAPEPQPPSGPVDNPTTRDAGVNLDAGQTTPPTTDRPRQELGAPGSGSADTGGDKSAQEACVDRWLEAHQLDRYGHPQGTMFPGGSPLFNERTGERRDRLEYVYSRQPDARKACADTGAK
jgi:hypothetical protein